MKTHLLGLGGKVVEDKSIDILGAKPLSKAVEHASTKTVDGVSAFLAAICMPAAEELGLLLRDRVASFRKTNLASIAEKAKEKLEHAKASPTGDCSPRLIHEVIEHGSWTDDSCIQNMWAGLIAAASSSVAAADDSLVYTDTLRRLTPFQARVLNYVYADPRCCSVATHTITDDAMYTPINPLIYSARELLELYPDDLSKFVNIAYVTHADILQNATNHSLALGRFRPQIDALVSAGLFRDACISNSEPCAVTFLPSMKGLDLYMRGLGYKVYPLEAFIVTQQHWCKLNGIDPALYRAI